MTLAEASNTIERKLALLLRSQKRLLCNTCLFRYLGILRVLPGFQLFLFSGGRPGGVVGGRGLKPITYRMEGRRLSTALPLLFLSVNTVEKTW